MQKNHLGRFAVGIARVETFVHKLGPPPMNSSPGVALQIRVFIVSNVRLHREGLVALLRGCPSIEVLGADSVQETQNVLRTTATDVALIDALSPSDSDTVGALNFGRRHSRNRD
jgi:hypothetical protein